MPDTKDTATTSTPILDSGILPPRTRQIKLRGLIVGFLIGISPGLVFAVMVRQGDRDPGLSVALLSPFSVLVAAIVVHELGHLLAGWAVGFRFSLIQIGPFSLRIVHGLLKVRFRQEMTAFGYAGMHVNRLRRLRRRMLVFLAAGPAANLLSVAVVLLINRFFPQLSSAWAAMPAFQFTVVSLLLGIVSVMPFPSDATSDGARIDMLLRSRARARRWLNILALVHANDQGVRAKSWKHSWVKAATSLNDASRDRFRGNLLAYMSANGRKDAPVAALQLEKCLELAGQLPISTRDVLAQEAAVFAAWFRNDAVLADKWSAQLRKPRLVSNLAKITLRIATSCARRDFDNAKKGWQEGLAFIDRATKGNSHNLLKESWLEWQAEILEREIQPPAMDGRYVARPCST
jgi:hypothetical protein